LFLSEVAYFRFEDGSKSLRGCTLTSVSIVKHAREETIQATLLLLTNSPCELFAAAAHTIFAVHKKKV
jgi:hypothetical protein